MFKYTYLLSAAIYALIEIPGYQLQIKQRLKLHLYYLWNKYNLSNANLITNDEKVYKLKHFDNRHFGLGVLYDTENLDYFKQFHNERNNTFLISANKFESFFEMNKHFIYPNNSLFIIENVEDTSIIPQLFDLTTESYNFCKFKTIAHSSDKKIIQALLNINTGEKVYKI